MNINEIKREIQRRITTTIKATKEKEALKYGLHNQLDLVNLQGKLQALQETLQLLDKVPVVGWLALEYMTEEEKYKWDGNNCFFLNYHGDIYTGTVYRSDASNWVAYSPALDEYFDEITHVCKSLVNLPTLNTLNDE